MLNNLTNDELFRHIQTYGPMTAMEAELLTRFEEQLDLVDAMLPTIAVLDEYSLTTDQPDLLRDEIEKLMAQASRADELGQELYEAKADLESMTCAADALRSELDAAYASMD